MLHFMPPKSDLVYLCLDDFVNVNESVVEKPIVETNEPETAEKKMEPQLLRIENLIVMKKMCLRLTSNKNSNFNEKVNIVKGNVTTIGPKAVVGDEANAVKASACWGNPQLELQEKGVIDNGCSRHMTGNKSYLSNYEEIDGGFFAFGGDPKRGKITGKGKISTDTECVALSPDFKLLDENHVLLKVSRKDNMYSVDLKNIVPSGDALTKSMNYELVVAGNQSNGSASTKACDDAGKARMETVPGKDYIVLPFLTQDPSFSSSSKDSLDAGFKPSGEEEKKDAKDPENEDSKVPNTEDPRVNQEQDANVNITNNINTVSPTVNAADIENNTTDENILYGCDDDPNMPNLEEIVYSDDDEGVGAKADMTNLDTHILVSPTLTTRIHKDHPLEQIIGDIHSAPQTRRMTKNVTEHEEPKKVWTLMDLPHSKRAIGTKWVYRNKKDERGIVIRNKARIKAIRLFLAYASFKDFVVYQMDVKSAFLYVKIKEEVYVYQPLGFKDSEFPDKVYKVEKKDDGIFISQDKYVDEILKKFGFSTVKTASTPMETSKPLLKDAEAEDVDVHLYRSMIGSLMYLTASRPDIMFAVCACARFQVTPKVSHLHAVKRIFRYLKGQPKLGLWYPKDSPFDLEAYTDSDYAGASLDRKSTTGGCQFLRRRLISWQCKKQTIVANSTTKAEYVAASSCCGQVLWIQNQMLDYGYNFMNTKIFIDNESTICIVKNLVFHSKTKHIEIRHHFIRDSYEKRLIQVIKIHTDHNSL
ncbi:putative reverse transcriptase, RNA-dependent DNA polymerase [Tanacetum coccineum]